MCLLAEAKVGSLLTNAGRQVAMHGVGQGRGSIKGNRERRLKLKAVVVVVKQEVVVGVIAEEEAVCDGGDHGEARAPGRRGVGVTGYMVVGMSVQRSVHGDSQMMRRRISWYACGREAHTLEMLSVALKLDSMVILARVWAVELSLIVLLSRSSILCAQMNMLGISASEAARVKRARAKVGGKG